MMAVDIDRATLAASVRDALLRRNAVCDAFFQREAPRLARACHAMSRRFLAGGRLLAFGQGAASTDAQHVAVEFVHPVIVGKRALPALDLSAAFAAQVAALVRPDDMVLGFALGGPDADVERALELARARGALTFALAGTAADEAFDLPDADPFVNQEVFELLYHVLWETVHVFFEHREQGGDIGASAFLYPMLGSQTQPVEQVIADVQQSLLGKVAEVNHLRQLAAQQQSATLADTAVAIAQRIARGGQLLIFGNGGSATDANDLALDCVAPPAGLRPIPAISLAAEPAVLSALANDIGAEVLFVRQLAAQCRPQDVAIGISTSGGSANVLAALAEARRRGLLTVGLVGYNGGRMLDEALVDHALVVDSQYIPRIQEAQASIYHVLRRTIDDVL